MTEPHLPTVRSQADLDAMWRLLMAPLGFGYRRVYVVFVPPDGRVVPRIAEISDLSELPDPELAGKLLTMCADLIDRHMPTGTRAACLYARPGGPDFTAADRRWGAALLRAADDAFVPMWPVHLANDHRLRVLAPDDLAHPA
jgi:hypothetical protein